MGKLLIQQAAHECMEFAFNDSVKDKLFNTAKVIITGMKLNVSLLGGSSLAEKSIK